LRSHTRPQISQTFLKYLDEKAARCNYTDYVSTYLTYPPKGLLPLPGGSVDTEDVMSGRYLDAALLINPAFNMYRIWDTVSVSCSRKVVNKLTDVDE
jgi:carboxypeptidase D